MPSRKRYTPARGFENRIVHPLERLAVGAADLVAYIGRYERIWPWPIVRSRPMPFSAVEIRSILVLRLDRIGDLTMSLPALFDLRAAYRDATIRLAVGRWNLEIARRAPVDRVLEWNAPWMGRRDEGADTWGEIEKKARNARQGLDLAIELSCDPRANYLLRMTRARRRVGYGNSGLGRCLTHVLPLDETVSWVEESRRAVAAITGRPAGTGWPAIVTPEEKRAAEERLRAAGLRPGGPVVGLHPSGGRRIKQWSIGKWIEVAARLRDAHGARFVLTGSAADRALTAPLAQQLGVTALDTAGSLTLDETLGILSVLDLLLSPDTGPMHLACAVDTPSVTVFGPSDPRRYFSGGTGASGTRHVVVKHDLWCAPCNQIRRPPGECDVAEGPECLRLVTADAVYNEASALLNRAGFPSPAP